MYRNRFWISFLSLLLLGILIYTGMTSYAIWQYFRLDQTVQAEEIQWSVISFSTDRFAPFAKYRFLVNGKEYQGETQWQKEYLNEWTAKEAVLRLKQSPPPVFYNHSNPALSTLENFFPLKKTLYMLFLWILTLYFIGLGSYVKKKTNII